MITSSLDIGIKLITEDISARAPAANYPKESRKTNKPLAALNIRPKNARTTNK
jgi:hypothetical protein